MRSARQKRSLPSVAETYRRRFGIESSYRQMNQARLRTSSRSPALRLLVVALAFLLRNLWARCNWMTLVRPGRGRRKGEGNFRFATLLRWICRKVKKGDLLATIDKSRLETQKSQLESNIYQATLQLQQIKAQIIAQENQIEAETRGINRTIASAQAELARNRQEYQDRKNTANAQVAEAIANLNSNQEELNQAQTELISLEADLKFAQASLNAAKSKRDRYAIINNSGALPQNQLEEAQLDVEQKEQAKIAKQAAIVQQHQEIARRKQVVAAAQARLNNSRVTLNPSQAEVAIAR